MKGRLRRGIPVDGYSVRWTGWVRAEQSEVYTFVTRTDDGVRLWVDGRLIIDDWTNHAPTERLGTAPLIAGRWYPIRMEYFERWGGALAQLSWQSPSRTRQLIPSTHLSATAPDSPPLPVDAGAPMPDAPAPMPDAPAPMPDAPAPMPDAPPPMPDAPAPPSAPPGLQATYFRDVNLGAVAMSRVDPQVNFNWGEASPATGIPIDGFSVRWRGWVQPLNSELYTFITRTDDGVRLWVDGRLIINDWINHAPTERRGDAPLVAGRWYPITMEYFERWGGAVAQLSWLSARQPRQIIPSARLSSSTGSP